MTISRKFSSFVAVVLLAGVTLSACGDKDDAGAKSESSSSSSAGDSGATLTQANFSTKLIAAQQKAGTGHMVMTIGAGGQSIKADGDVKIGKSFADTSMSMSMDMGSAGPATMKVLLVDGIMYLNLGQITQSKYAKIDLTDENSAFGKQFGDLAEQMDPAHQLAQFDKAVTSFKKKGAPEKIDGVDAQPYEVVVDTSKIDALGDLPGGSSAGVPKSLTYVMYVGPDNLLRRMSFELAGSKSQVDYSKWGEDVDIKAPSAGEISDQDLGKMMSGGAAG